MGGGAQDGRSIGPFRGEWLDNLKAGDRVIVNPTAPMEHERRRTAIYVGPTDNGGVPAFTGHHQVRSLDGATEYTVAEGELEQPRDRSGRFEATDEEWRLRRKGPATFVPKDMPVDGGFLAGILDRLDMEKQDLLPNSLTPHEIARRVIEWSKHDDRTPHLQVGTPIEFDVSMVNDRIRGDLRVRVLHVASAREKCMAVSDVVLMQARDPDAVMAEHVAQAIADLRLEWARS